MAIMHVAKKTAYLGALVARISCKWQHFHACALAHADAHAQRVSLHPRQLMPVKTNVFRT